MRSPHHMHIRNVWEHSPTQKRIIEMVTIKDRGVVRICVTAPMYLPGPTNPWALHLPTPCHVTPLTGVRVDPCGLLPCLHATCASRGPRAALPRGLSVVLHPRAGPARHISFRAPCHPRGLWNKKTPIFDFFNYKYT